MRATVTARHIGLRPVLATTLALLLLVGSAARAQDAAVSSLSARLSDQEFWRLVVDSSEPNGFFQSDNLVGNDRPLPQVVPALREVKRGGVYLGVAPDQNFTYIVALEPKIAFIVDIRRDNLLEHLRCKAIVELSPTRADFVARLFSLPRPDLGIDATAVDLFRDYRTMRGNTTTCRENLSAITQQLTKVHGFPLSPDDLDGIRSIYETFCRVGPALTYSGGGGGGQNMPTYAELQQSTDLDGHERGYLATEENDRFLRGFEQENLLVPVVGDFAGPKALRAVGAYLALHGATVTAFYVSNVEQYLFKNVAAPGFYANVATLPIDDRSVFIRSASGRNVLDPIRALLEEFDAGGLQDYMAVSVRGAVH